MTTTARIFDRHTTPAGEMNGRRVRVVTGYSGYSEAQLQRFAGLEGTCTYTRPDSDGDIYVQFDTALDDGRTYVYAREWTFLDGVESEPVEDGSNPVGPEPTPAEARLERLIDAIYQGARTNGYMSLVPQLFENAGIPLRKANRTAKIRGLRIISPAAWVTNDEALAALRASDAASDTPVVLNRTVADYTVSVPWVETETEGERMTCSDLAYALAQGDFADVPNEVLIKAGRAIGLGSNPDNFRRTMVKHAKAGSEYGLTLTCDHC